MRLVSLFKIASKFQVKHYHDPKEAAQFLGVSLNNLTEESLKKAYRRKALELHPDRNPDKDTTNDFKSLESAYSLLRNNLNKSKSQHDIFWPDEEDDWVEDHMNWAEEELDPEEEAEWDNFEENIKPKVDKMSLMDFWKWYIIKDKISEPLSYYQFNKWDMASGEELISLYLSLKDLQELDRAQNRKYSRAPNPNYVEHLIVKRLEKGTMDKSALKKLSPEQWRRISELWSIHTQNVAERKYEDAAG